MRFLIAFGTRPEYIKLVPLINKMERGCFDIVYVKQHDITASIDIRYVIPIVSNSDSRLNDIIASILSDRLIDWSQYTHTIVQGDTATAFAIALSSFNNQVDVVHIEAGLRTYSDEPFPEEMFRKSISAMAKIHFCPGVDSYNNLISERVQGRVFITGNTINDSIHTFLKQNNLLISYSNVILITLHRRENWNKLPHYYELIEKLANTFEDIKFRMVVHPNKEIQTLAAKILKKCEVILPLNNDDFLIQLATCKLVITDSGGIQEECAVMGKKCIVFRTSTERTELIDNVVFLVDTFDEIKQHIEDYIVKPNYVYGSGDSVDNILHSISLIK